MQEIVEIGRATQDELRDDLRELFQGAIRLTLEMVLEEELKAMVGARRFERVGSRKDHRNGTYLRRLLTSLGQIEVAMPRSRDNGSPADVIGRYQRRSPELDEMMVEAYVSGVSQRKMGDVTEALMGERVGRSTVSRVAKRLDEAVEGLRRAPIEGPHPYLYLDATFLDARWARKVENVSALVAYAVGPEGHRRLLAVTLGAEESQQSWSELLEQLQDRGLGGVELVIADEHAGLAAAVRRFLPEARRQRCTVHLQRNVGVTASDVEKKLKVRVSFTDDLNSEEARESDGTVKNTPPTASDGRVTARENQDYTFTAADFNFSDSDGDPLASVTIKVRPESGALKLDNARVRVDAMVTRAQLDAGSLTYTPQTDQTGTGVAFFYFAVSDGAAESASVYTMTIDIAEDTIAPGRPRNLTAVPGNGAVALHWEAPSSPGSSAIVRYEVRHAAGDAVPPATAWESVGLTFTHPVTGLADGEHTFEVRAVNSSSPSEGTAAQVQDTPSATLTPSVSMEEVEVRVAEDAGTAVVTVVLDRPSTSALTVPWYTADDTAVSPDDYIGGQGSVTFAPGETRNTISVRIVDDALREDPVDGRHEQFLVLPSRGDGYRLQHGGEALSVVIEDNDGDGPVTGDTRPPLLTQATVDGRTLVLTYDEAL